MTRKFLGGVDEELEKKAIVQKYGHMKYSNVYMIRYLMK